MYKFDGDRKNWPKFQSEVTTAAALAGISYINNITEVNTIKENLIPPAPHADGTAPDEFEKMIFQNILKEKHTSILKLKFDFDKILGIVQSRLTQNILNQVLQFNNGIDNSEIIYRNTMKYLKSNFGNSSAQDATILLTHLNDLNLDHGYEHLLAMHHLYITQLTQIEKFDGAEVVIGNYCPEDQQLIAILKKQIECEQEIGKLVCYDLINKPAFTYLQMIEHLRKAMKNHINPIINNSIKSFSGNINNNKSYNNNNNNKNNFNHNKRNNNSNNS
jgi:hypothetical protein